MKVHKSITFDRIESHVRESMFGLANDGICLDCGNVRGGCEPDARGYPCGACGGERVYGMQEAMMMGAYHQGGES